MDKEVLVKVEGVSKKFCKDLKRSLWYGLQDIIAELFGLKKSQELRKDEFWAVKDVSFELKRGECLGLIGHNGAGKSTLLKMLNGLIKPDKGKITMKGRIGALIELGAGFNPILTGRENVFNNGAVLGFSQQEIARKYKAIVEFAELEEFMDTPVQNYSSGMKVRLGFAVAAQMEPDVLIIDEVLAVGDVGFRIKCIGAINKILRNSAVILVSHAMQQISRVCTVGLLMGKGRMKLMTHNIGELTENYFRHYSVGEKCVSGAGEGKLEINEVSIENVKGHATERILHYQSFSIAFGLVNGDDIRKIHVRIIVFNLENRPVFDYYSGLTCDGFEINNGNVRVSCTVPPTTLNAGKYSISIVVIDQRKFNVLYRIDNALSFNISSSYFSYSENFSEASWQIQ